MATLYVYPDDFSEGVIDRYAPLQNDLDHQHFLYGIPAPRGVIVDREGKPLARSRAAERLVVNLSRFVAENGDNFLADSIVAIAEELADTIEGITVPTSEDVERHWQHRPHFPFSLSEPLAVSEVLEAECLATYFFGSAAALQDVYLRTYPAGEIASHIVGYVGRTAPDQHGPLVDEEPLWPRFEGRYGLEETLDDKLRGEDGVLSVVYDERGREVFRQTVRPPVPGLTVVTSLNLSMQQVAYDALVATKHRGAVVLVDSVNGDILTSVSNPSFDSSIFVPSIQEEDFRSVADAEGSPLFNRAVSATYPPGSTFKPIVALAGLKSIAITRYDRFEGPPAMMIDGLEFKNWSRSHEGYLDVRYALLRSCNTWFYQAAFDIRDQSILSTAQTLGLSIAPDIPLTGVATGNLPEKAPSRRGLANLSIGQGEVLASPLQMAVAMTPFATRGTVALPRLVQHYQHPVTHQIVKQFGNQFVKVKSVPLNFDTVREGMWGVVHHSRGTAKSAQCRRVSVLGKTGTSQWMSDGIEQRVAWFTGFVDAADPQISFAVLTEGRPGESMSGGRNAAPVIAKILEEVYAEPEQFLVSRPDRPSMSRPQFEEPGRGWARIETEPVITEIVPASNRSRSRSSGGRGFFQRLFGKKR